MVHCHVGVLGSNPGGAKRFSTWNYFTGGSGNLVAPESASGSGSRLYLPTYVYLCRFWTQASGLYVQLIICHLYFCRSRLPGSCVIICGFGLYSMSGLNFIRWLYHSFSRRFSKALTLGAHTTFSVNEFHMFTTLETCEEIFAHIQPASMFSQS